MHSRFFFERAVDTHVFRIQLCESEKGIASREQLHEASDRYNHGKMTKTVAREKRRQVRRRDEGEPPGAVRSGSSGQPSSTPSPRGRQHSSNPQ